ncbi:MULTISPECIES: DUF2938 domain-containing protein [Ensifer]|jgi:hypothetical protein|uniref:DUF2938 family protein n=1 Tax=Ensifer canadensis TaxID=555315 RepID=A0AAW4FFN0_9HYPH|nr:MULTISPECIES: DUF2938 domain-containing protein [Ensifer]MDP9628254.1 hypothetical protein [Ensifer adhaerens]KQU71750.1 hypothetical protein ASD00_16780 [Ensifer sp. Root31]KQW62622.1 hypothetical protein ASD02_00355 [Ensifer sp. Root1252]KQW84738.1 hypothetical protein ASD03_03100 [Ensifer sp. Root127]KQY71544.1 hypothetical protein ASD52_07740 [Ensifer sp. Root142]
MEKDLVLQAILIGIGATAVMDLWAVAVKRLLGIPSLDYGMVGRWIGHFPQGRFLHQRIAAAAPVRSERLIGWTAHYAIGVVFAGLLLLIWGTDWAERPTLVPALIVGLATVVAPFFLMQPGMGAGIAASKTPSPNIARLRSLLAHAAFGFGLYLSALALSVLWRS